MAISVLNTETRVNIKYPAKTGFNAYSLGLDVKNGATDDKYYAFAQAIIPMVDADSRTCEEITLTITETVQ